MNNAPAPAPAKSRTHLRKADLRGASRLAVSATIGLTDLVENLHHNIARVSGPFGAASQRPTKGITGLVYRSIRGVTRLVGGSLEALLGQVEALLGPGMADSSAEHEAVVAALNGVLGDHLEASANPLAIQMRLLHEGAPLTFDEASLARALPSARRRVLVMVHGLCMHPGQWRSVRDGGGSFDLGAALATEGGFTPLHLHYNTGRHVSTNGRQFAELLQTLLRSWPTPLEELVIVGHSMGGLVARSAVHQAMERGEDWPRHLKAMVFLGTPHHGAPLERGGHWIDLILGASPYTAAFARLGQLRSAGITDLRHGNLLEADWSGADRFARGKDTRANVPLPAGVACYAVAASLGAERGALREKLMGDGLVPVASALGQHRQAARCLAFPADRRLTIQGLNHLELMASDAVHAQLSTWLTAPRRRPRASDGVAQIGGSPLAH
ncbi:MAG: alpha/beta hydrolase [Burkholderiaceae bacterium]|nr:alpha/beta hydrolase [Burkholderiaceae bacterium]